MSTQHSPGENQAVGPGDLAHRSATPLELFFDLCFVVAVAQGASGLHHAVAEDHVAQGVSWFVLVFFAIWWAWMGFTWFASGYQTDDLSYRLTAFGQMAGALVMAAGVPAVFTEHDFRLIAVGYTIMRVCLIWQMLRVTRADPTARTPLRRWAAGLAAVQAAWLVFAFVPRLDDLVWSLPVVALVVAELAIPLWMQRARGGRAEWHAGHIAERYGLFTLIVLGESVLAASTAIRDGLDQGVTVDLVAVICGGLLIVIALWWVYFDRGSDEERLGDVRVAYVWGYGHYFVFSSAAAVGAGLAVATAYSTHHAEVGPITAAASVAVPVSVFMLSLWLLRRGSSSAGPALPVGALGVLAAAFGPHPVLVIGLVLTAVVVVDTVIARPGTGG